MERGWTTRSSSSWRGAGTRVHGTLVERHQARTYATLMKLTGNHDLAMDLTQDAFVRAWQQLGAFEGRSAFSTWLYRIAVRLAYDAIARERRLAPAGDAVDAARAEMERVRRDQMEGLARILNPEQRAKFLLLNRRFDARLRELIDQRRGRATDHPADRLAPRPKMVLIDLFIKTRLVI